MATIYSTKTGDTITDGLQSSRYCDEAIQAALRIARTKNETVILDDDGELLVGPRGGIRKFSTALKLKMGFFRANDAEE